MAVLSWGKPKVETGKLTANDGAPSVWTQLPEIVNGTATLTTEKGNKTEAVEEGGGIVDVRYEKSKYSFECELFVKKGDEKPIVDEDGIVIDNYAIRLTPEDPETEGFIMDKTSVSCVETWTSADGKRWKYTFDGLIPKTGKILKPYTGT
ncbi:MAG: hypothetical protein FWF53_03390 [Candidatus Azobacteroides sp.]|nr:hypothetical protein [Candidatus Azobacteroides sp.]